MQEAKRYSILFVSNTANFQKFNLPYMRWCKEQGWRVDYASPADEKVTECDNYYEVSIARNPFSFGNMKAILQLHKILKKGNYTILHCHTPMGGVVARLAAIFLRKKTALKVTQNTVAIHHFAASWTIPMRKKYMSLRTRLSKKVGMKVAKFLLLPLQAVCIAKETGTQALFAKIFNKK